MQSILRFTSISLFCLISAVALVAGGCGSDNGAANQDGGGEPSVGCNFENCKGCCDGDTCVESITDDKCGQPGAACRACGATETCLAGRCAVAKPCDANCQGCCLDGNCVEGNSILGCGTGGEICDVCFTDNVCDNAECKASRCDATTCPNGCCTANGECATYGQQSLDSCGKGGDACTVCPDGTPECTLGTCVGDDQPCLDFCDDGCCTPEGQCVPFIEQDPTECGAAEACGACTPGQSCVTGMCTGDPVWTITFKSTVVADTDADGGDWDQTLFSNPLPDPYAGVALAGSSSIDEWTKTIDDTLTPNWNEELIAYLESELLSGGLDITIRDSDGVFGIPYETMSTCTAPVSAADLIAGSITVAVCGDKATMVVIEFTLQ